jgi:peroxiredoxin
MVLLESVKIPLGSSIPEFTLNDPSGKTYQSDKLFTEKGLLVVFTCNHCPYAQAVWPRLLRLAQYAQGLKINTVAINPNINPNYPDDSPAEMAKRIQEWKIDFPYLVDEKQDVAKQFKAQCTPDIYLFNSKKELVYHGRIDDNWKDESAVTREELKEALNNLAIGNPISKEQRPSMGCSIKWLP